VTETPSVEAEATGETVGEAKLNALRDLERLVPGLDRARVRFQVLSEGKRGLLGIGYTPARVLASAEAVAPRTIAAAVDESVRAARVRRLLEHVTAAIGVQVSIEIEESDDAVVGLCDGPDIGLLIGKHGTTIDAVQTLAGAIANRGLEERKDVVVDAGGYRERRRRALEAMAIRCAQEAVRTGERVELEPMSSSERRVVHERLKRYEGVRTTSEGDEPHRYVVVEPA
jgi:spoIIIJ-associated protein